jgi:Xaa-Pro aminopeptidase
LSADRAAFRGDATLTQLLRQAGSSQSVAQVKDLVRGVNAGAVPAEDAEWIALIAADPSPELAAQLTALRRGLPSGGGTAPADRTDRLARLRAELGRQGVEGFIVPRADEHQGEYVPARAQRLEWLTGFTGSAGFAIVLANKAAVFVDGRYTLQVRQQVSDTLFEPRHVTDQPAEAWLAEWLKSGDRLGYDPWLHTVDGLEKLRPAVQRAGATLVPVTRNPIDAVWADQPPVPLAPVVPHDVAFAGEGAGDKRRRIAEAVVKSGADAAVLTLPESVAWLLNLRGRDVPRTPLPLCFAILDRSAEVDLFIDPRKLSPQARTALGNAVRVRSPGELESALRDLAKAGRKVLADASTAPSWVFDRLGAAAVRGADPCLLPKACKNDVELAGTRAAHRRDGRAVTRFLAWLDDAAVRGGLNESTAAARLESFRRENERFRDLSFDTISGAGSNGAIVHYKFTEETDRPIRTGELYLVDSGAQYLDGTTDVTRTVAIGAPTDEHRDRFTRVLRGHIALATARFPVGTSGSQLDALARVPLWQAGLDYDHGTGHGVGSYLSVHEGPHRISKIPNTQALKPGMIVSNEPGYYKTGAYGIRVENLVVVVEVPKPEGAERDLLGFDTLTLAPIDRNLVEPSLMTDGELAWLNAYHRRVRDTLLPDLDGAAAAWLEQATQPIRHAAN